MIEDVTGSSLPLAIKSRIAVCVYITVNSAWIGQSAPLSLSTKPAPFHSHRRLSCLVPWLSSSPLPNPHTPPPAYAAKFPSPCLPVWCAPCFPTTWCASLTGRPRIAPGRSADRSLENVLVSDEVLCRFRKSWSHALLESGAGGYNSWGRWSQ